MNKILTIVFICLFINANIAQNNLIFNYNNTGAGRNISLVFSKEFFNKNEVGLGFRFNINKNYHVDNQNNIQASIDAFFVGPRAAMITPWSTNAVEITQNMGIDGIVRIEEFVKVTEDFSDFEDKVSIFYKSITAENFVQLQLDNRKIWENYFTKEGYFVSLHSQLQKQFL